MEEPKRTRGRPKQDFDPYIEKLNHRLVSGDACETLEAEARYLEQWGITTNLKVPGGAPLGIAAIRERIKKRLGGGAQQYKFARKHNLSVRKSV